MKRIYFNPIPKAMIVWLMVFSFGCSDSFFEKQPLDAVSDGTFWKTENDAMLALVGCYRGGGYEYSEWTSNDFWNPWALLNLEMMAGNGSEKELGPDNVTNGSLTSTNGFTGEHWRRAYMRIASCNIFLDHINDIPMDEAKKAMMIGEVRTLRAFEYFNLAFYFGDVPLVTTTISIEEANNVTRTPKAEVMAFAETELKESAVNLPSTRPTAEDGRITSGAAQAILGRLQMADQNWDDAAATYEEIIDADNYGIEPNFKGLFYESGELNNEFVLTSQYKEDDYKHVAFQFLYPETWGGWHQFSPYNELVQDFECTDGKTISESPLYDPNNPYDNRDPRLDYTILISDRSVFKGTTFISRPGTSSPDRMDKYNWSGYCISKFMDENGTTNLPNSGLNWPLIRYAEVLLSYLESKIEAGDPIDQALLDATINKVRGRTSVAMPPVTTTDAAELQEIIRRERRVEFAFEGLRYYDILRWGIAAQELNRSYTGMKLTNDPENYDDFPVDGNGFFIYQQRHFKEGINELWPIPQSERDLNKNLTQNFGY